MDQRRVSALVLGAWIMGSLFMIFVAIQNFQMADVLGNSETHAALRDMAGRLNQVFFVNWERAELLLGILLTAALIFGVRSRIQAGLSGALLILVAIQHFGVTPQMLSLAAHLDNASAAGQFGRLHAIYGVMEVVKLVGLVALAVILIPNWRRRAAAVDVQPIDYAHHGHVDR
ncbi:MAG TPA: hypothetical protein VMH05_10215 [Bryobacteraceae bacterium]|nr:hypothetical protein [Bryobacteraceae bacterium]